MNTGANVITEMGLLSQMVYLELGVKPLKNGTIIKTFREGDQTYTLNDSYEVIDHTPDSSLSGFQALLLKSGDEYVIAFRGTELSSPSDWITDLLAGTANINLQYSSAVEFVNNALAIEGVDKSNLTLTGHSLGGILTQQVGASMGIQGYAYNPWGADALSKYPPNGTLNIVARVLEAVGIYTSSAEAFAKDNIANISYQDGGNLNGDILSNLLTGSISEHLGDAFISVWGEDVGAEGHRMKVLNSAIDHYNKVLDHFTQDTTYEDLSKAYLLTGGFERVEDVFHDLGIYDTANNSLHFNFLDDKLPSQLQNTDKANLYALKHLLPFTIEGNLPAYDSINPGDYSEMYIADRAYYLYYTMDKENRYNEEGLNYYEDTALGDAYTLNKGDWNNKVIFGSNSKDDTLEGDANSDHLYGNGGDDTLKGGEGNDYLEGGSGYDTYVITGKGKNTIVENFTENGTTVAGGKINFKGNILGKATDSDGDGIYTDAYNNSYTINGSDLTISSSDAETEARVKNYDEDNNSLGIYLEDGKPESEGKKETLEITKATAHSTYAVHHPDQSTAPSDSAALDFYRALYPNKVIKYVGSNTYNLDNKDDNVKAKSGSDTIRTNDGNDTITTTDGNDYIDSGNGWDSVNAAGDNNTINTGEGNDSVDTGNNATIDTGNGSDTVVAGNNANITSSNGWNDFRVLDDADIETGAGRDTIKAGNNATINSGAGSDTIDAGENAYVSTSQGYNSIKVKSNAQVYGGNQADNITARDFSLIQSGGGSDAINAGNENTIDAGSGNNTIKAGNQNSVTAKDGNNSINADDNNLINFGNGNNSATLNSSNELTTGSGSDSVKAYSNNTLELSAGNNSVDAKDSNFVQTLGGDDTIKVLSDNQIYSGNGNDTVDAINDNTIDTGDSVNPCSQFFFPAV